MYVDGILNTSEITLLEIDSKILDLVASATSKEAGFRLLMTTYQERLYWHIRRLVTVHEDTDDVLQNTFVKVYRNIEKFEGGSKLYTWLYRIATNETITFLNKRNKNRSEQLDGLDHDLSEKISADPYWSGDQAQLILQLAIDTLPDKQKAVFTMRYYDETPYKEMSEILETSEGALKASYHHAVKKIEHYINENAHEYQ